MVVSSNLFVCVVISYTDIVLSTNWSEKSILALFSDKFICILFIILMYLSGMRDTRGRMSKSKC